MTITYRLQDGRTYGFDNVPRPWLATLGATLADERAFISLNAHPGRLCQSSDGIKVLFVDHIACVEVAA